ncbi:MAG: sialidase family protein, partial [Bacteroidota bacterium]
LHSANVALTPDAGTMFLTICQDESLHQQNQCEIFYREKRYEGDWGSPKKLPGNINLKGSTTMQPTIGWDRSLKKYVLFFVSNRPGGKGGLDVWASAQEADGTFSEPKSLPFNTEKDEVTPYFYMPTQTLFFSSNGGQNFGGLDIFNAVKTGVNTWSVASNLGFPINGGYDDLYFTYHTNARRGYFSSNRPGARCSDFSAGCLCCDLFEIEFLEAPAFILGKLSRNSQITGADSPPCFSIQGEIALPKTRGGLSTQ